MSNNNNWGQPGSNHNGARSGQSPAQRQQPPFQRQPHGGHGHASGGAEPPYPPYGHSPGNAVAFEGIQARFNLVAKRAAGSVLKAWLAISLIPFSFLFVASLLAIGAKHSTSLSASAAFTSISLVVSIVALLALLLSVVGQYALFKPLNTLIFEDPVERLGLFGTIKSASGVYLPTLGVMILSALSCAFGLALCVLPGLIAAVLLCQVHYLSAAKKLSPIEAMRRSFELNTKHWPKVLLIFLGMLAIGIVGSVIEAWKGGGGHTSDLGVLLLLTKEVVAWGVLQVTYFFLFVLQATVFSSIETQETGRMPAQFD